MDCVDFLSKLDKQIKQIKLRIKENENFIANFNIDSLVQKNLELIKRYATKQLAQILYECVECQNMRQDIDWSIAEQFLNKNFTDEMWIKLTQQDIILRTYDNLRAEFMYPEIGFDLIEHSDGYFKEFNRIIKILNSMKEYSENEIDKKLLNSSNSNNQRSHYLRRLIWDWAYQRMKYDLPRPPYGNIIFS